MTDYEFQGPARVCAATGRELKPGDRFHAVLTEHAGKMVRTDYAADAWPGLPHKPWLTGAGGYQHATNRASPSLTTICCLDVSTGSRNRPIRTD